METCHASGGSAYASETRGSCFIIWKDVHHVYVRTHHIFCVQFTGQGVQIFQLIEKGNTGVDSKLWHPKYTKYIPDSRQILLADSSHRNSTNQVST